MRGDVARKALHHDRHGHMFLTEAANQLRRIAVVAERVQISRLAFENRVGSGEAIGRQARRQHAGFRRASEMQLLHHGAGVRMSEFE